MKNKPRRGRPVTGVTLTADERRRLRAGRGARGMTRAALAQELCVSFGALHAWEDGSRRVSASVLARWREAVGVPAGVTTALLK